MDKFPTEAYVESGLPICPNGDQVRSDELGLFCWIESQRIDAEIVNGKVRLLEPEPELPEKKAKVRV